MCGIAGVAGWGTDRAGAMRRMRACLVHRGPDSEGEHVSEAVALGVRRLRIIDLTAGDQPQSNEDGSVWTVFNGEIYNFLELRSELLARGHILRTDHSDTEVIPHLYEDLGPAFVERLHGMFALAVWDARTRTLLLARDRMGKKPVLYYATSEGIAFASEHAALLAGGRPDIAVDPDAIRLYLRLGYVPDPHDAFAGVAKLPPAHTLIWRDGHVEVRPYWSPEVPIDASVDEADAVERVRELLRDAVARRLIADVPLGAFLSGGLDSSAIVATMASLTDRVRTFTIGFQEGAFSELAHARRIAERFGTEHHELVVEPSATSVVPQLVRHYGEPFADSSALPTFCLSQATRAQVTVALNGDGGDETFGGYDRYLAARAAAIVPRAVAASLSVASALIPRGASRMTERARRLLAALPRSPGERYLEWIGLFSTAQLDDLLEPAFRSATQAADDEVVGAAEALFRQHDPLTAAQRCDIAYYLPGDLLPKVDIASMANSLEVRSPLLDHRLVALMLAVPPEIRVRRGERKRVLALAMEGILPRETLRRRKQGFGVPIAAWLRGDLRPWAEERLLPGQARVRMYARGSAVERLVREHMSGRADHGQRLWALAMLEEWHHAFPSSAHHPHS
jgi:asparagine synthase (glutamine-hydrolysing)